MRVAHLRFFAIGALTCCAAILVVKTASPALTNTPILEDKGLPDEAQQIDAVDGLLTEELTGMEVRVAVRAGQKPVTYRAIKIFKESQQHLGQAEKEITFPDIHAVVDSKNAYSEITAGHFSPAVTGALARVYVPNAVSNDVDVIDPTTLQVVDQFKVCCNPQHVVPSWDLKTLWVVGDGPPGSLTPIDPLTGKAGDPIPVPEAYNMYFTADGKSAIIVAEGLKRLEFRDPKTMTIQSILDVPGCLGVNHADFSIDGRYAIFSCEFCGGLVKIDIAERKVVGLLKLSKGGMPQDVRISPDGKIFYVADMMADGVFLVDGDAFAEIGFIATGTGTHSLYPSRDGTKLYVANRGSHDVNGHRQGPGSISVLDFATRKIQATWPIPGGGSPDMGNVSADGKVLWLSGRYDDVVYAIDTSTGTVKSIPVGRQPHGLTVWPQPGRYSLGHTGNMR